MSITIGKTLMDITISEDSLKLALEEFILKHENKQVTITYLKHLVGERTEGYGGMEMDIPYQEGVSIVCEEVW